MLEELHRSHVAKKKREGETLGDHRIKNLDVFGWAIAAVVPTALVIRREVEFFLSGND
jgi:hypothetical protein